MKPLIRLSIASLLVVTCVAASWYTSNRTRRDLSDNTGLTVVSPEEAGLEESVLERGHNELARSSRPYSFLVLRGGQIAYERYYNRQDTLSSNNIHSASKSILCVLAVLAEEQGHLRLTDRLEQHYPEHYTSFSSNDPRRQVTLEHLIQMRSGYRWTEDSTENQIQRTRDWTESLIKLPNSSRPGSRFHYSTGNTHLLAAAVQRAVAEPLATYAQRELFNRLGIEPEFWGSDPQGIQSGGYNFFCTARELAAFGLFWNHRGRGVMSRSSFDRIESSLMSWSRARVGGRSAHKAWGWSGQYLYVVRELDLVVVLTATSDGREMDGDRFLSRHVLPAVNGPAPPPPPPDPDPDPEPDPDPDPPPPPATQYRVVSDEMDREEAERFLRSLRRYRRHFSIEAVDN